MKWRSKYIATHGCILTKGGGKAKIGIFGLIREKVSGRDKEKIYLFGIPISWASGESLGISTSSYAGEIQAAFRGLDTPRFLKSTLSEFLFGNGSIEIETRIRNDNSSDVEHVHPIKSVTQERRLNGTRERNREEYGTKPRLALSHITPPPPLNITDE